MNWGLSSLLHVMHMCREANLTSSSSWMYIAYNIYWSLFTFNWYQDASLTYFQLISCLWSPLIDLIFVFRQKGGEICFYCFDWQKGGQRFLPLIVFIVLIVYPFVDDWQKGGEEFELICTCFIYMFCLSFYWYKKHYLFCKKSH